MTAEAARPAGSNVGDAASAAADLEKLPVGQVLAKLAVRPEQGLSSAEAKQRLAQFGPNALIEHEVSA